MVFSFLAFGHVISSENFSPKTKTTTEDITLLLGSVLTLVVPVGGGFSHYQYDIQLEIRLVGIFHSPMQHVSFSWLVGFFFLTFKRVIATENFHGEMPSK